MKVVPLATCPHVLLLEPNVFGIDRGFFFEGFNQAIFIAAIMREVHCVQDNHSHSAKHLPRHGLVALSNTANVRWDDQVLVIKWPIQQAPILSVKDRQDDMFAVAALF